MVEVAVHHERDDVELLNDEMVEMLDEIKVIMVEHDEMQLQTFTDSI